LGCDEPAGHSHEVGLGEPPLEQHGAIHLEHRHAVTVEPLERRVAVHVDEVPGVARRREPQRRQPILRLLAEVAAAACVEHPTAGISRIHDRLLA
jgi:hypothetical protein